MHEDVFYPSHQTKGKENRKRREGVEKRKRGRGEVLLNRKRRKM